MVFHICHLLEWATNIKPYKPPHLPRMEYRFCHMEHHSDDFMQDRNTNTKNLNPSPYIRTYNVFPHVTTPSQVSDISMREELSSLFFVRYQIYSPTPSCPPKYVFCGTTSLSSQQSGIISSKPVGSPAERIHILDRSSKY